MRILQSATQGDVPTSGIPSFSQFLCDQPSVAMASSSITEYSRKPEHIYMMDAQKLSKEPQRSLQASNKRRILDSDDDETNAEKTNPSSRNISTSPDEWLTTRKSVRSTQNPQGFDAKMSKNNVIALDDEDDLTDTPARKKPSLSTTFKSSYKEISSSSRDNMSDIAKVDGEHLVDVATISMLSVRSANGVKDSTRAEDVQIDLVDGDSDDDEVEKGNDNGSDAWHNSMTKSSIQKQADNILAQCKQISTELQKSLSKWGESDEQASSSAAATSKGDDMHDCINLVQIRQGKNLIRNEDLVSICAPGLALKGYQLVGVNWIKLLHENKVNGVLADDMGLGKTIQTIVFLGWLKAQHAAGHSARSPPPAGSGGPTMSSSSRKAHLIVVPASTLANWQNELARFCPSLQVQTYHGSQSERQELRYELRTQLTKGTLDVLLCTYTIFEREASKVDRAFLGAQQFNFLVLDEAHCIKNANSSRFEHLNILKTKHRLLLSGTPVQNDLSELLALLSFLMPKMIGRHQIEYLLTSFGWTKGTSKGSSMSGRSLAQLRGMLAPFVLRRLKQDVLDQLSDKETVLKKLDMSASQKSVYENILLGHALRKEAFRAQRVIDAEASRVLDGKITGGAANKGKLQGLSTESSPSVVVVATSSAAVIDLTSPLPQSVHSSSTGTGIGAPAVAAATASAALSPCDGDAAAKVTGCTADKIEEGEGSAQQIVGAMSVSEANHLFTALRKAANHPLLLRVRYKDESVLHKIASVAYASSHFGNQCDLSRVRAEIETFSDFDLHQLCLTYESALKRYQLDAEVLYDSPKMQLLKTLLPQLQAEGHRVLLFSQWTRVLDLLEVLLQDINMGYLRLDGSTPVKERQQLIDQFSMPENQPTLPVFLLSTKAGGLGINLTAADIVIMHDLDFNPENDKQAEDRCHRIGQTKPVVVYKLVATGTVDEDIYEMGERKRQLSHAVLCDGSSRGAGSSSSADGTPSSSAHRGGGGHHNHGSSNGSSGGDDTALISKILQKALAQVMTTRKA